MNTSSPTKPKVMTPLTVSDWAAAMVTPFTISGGDITRRRQQTVKHAGADANHGDGDDVIHAHGNAVRAETGFPFQMIQHVGEQRHERIGAGQSTDVFDELTNQHDGHICRERPADCAADSVEDGARQRHIQLAEFFRQRQNTFIVTATLFPAPPFGAAWMWTMPFPTVIPIFSSASCCLHRRRS